MVCFLVCIIYLPLKIILWPIFSFGLGAFVSSLLGSVVLFLIGKRRIRKLFFLYLRVTLSKEGKMMSDFGTLVCWTGSRASLSSIARSILLPLRCRFFRFLGGLIPRKIRLFTCQVVYGRTNMLDRLVRKMPSLVGPFSCILCRKAEEDLDHFSFSFLKGWPMRAVTKGRCVDHMERPWSN